MHARMILHSCSRQTNHVPADPLNRSALSGSPGVLALPTNVRYLRQFGKHILTTSFTARDPFRTLVGVSLL